MSRTREVTSAETRCRRVRALARSGFLVDPPMTRAFLVDCWGHIHAWLRHDEPAPQALADLQYHLEAYSKDAFAPRATGVSLPRADLEALARQLAEYLAQAVLRALARNRSIEALLRRDYANGLAGLDAPHELMRLLGLLHVVERHLAWPDAQAPPELARAVARLAADADPEGPPAPPIYARLVARVLDVLLPIYGGVHQSVLVPLAGSHPGVVRVTVAVTLAGPDGAGPAAPREGEPRDGAAASGSARRAALPATSEAQWLGLPVSSDVRDGAQALLGLLPSLALGAARRVTRVHVFISETSHRPLDRTVRLMAGRSWEAGGLLALLATLLGRDLSGTAVTGQVDVRTGTIEAVGGIEEKVEALFACRHPEHGPLTRRLLCPERNVAAAERAARRLGWDGLVVQGLRSIAQLPELAGADPWRAHCATLIAAADAEWPAMGLPEAVRDEWRRRVRAFLAHDERVLVVPSPFGVAPEAWARQLAALAAAERLGASGGGGAGAPAFDAVPVIVPAHGTAAAGIAEVLAAGVDGGAAADRAAAAGAPRADKARRGADASDDEMTAGDAGLPAWSNRYQSPGGFAFFHADPTGESPLLDPPTQHLLLTRRHPALRHQFCFVAAHLQQLEAWKANSVLARL